MFVRVNVGTGPVNIPTWNSGKKTKLTIIGYCYQLGIFEVTKLDEIAQRTSSLRNELRTEVSGTLTEDTAISRGLHGKGTGSKLALCRTTGKEEERAVCDLRWAS